MDDAAQKVLIVRPTALGDVARTVPALVTLRRALPNARIDWLVHNGLTDVVAHHPALDQVIAFPRKQFGLIWRSIRVATEALTWARQLHANHYDMAIDLQGLFRSGLLTWLTGAPWRVGFANAREMAHLAYNHAHHVDTRLHTVDRSLALLRAEGFKPHDDMQLYVGEQDQQWRETFIREHLPDQGYVTLAPTARWPCKCWPQKFFIELARRIIDSRRLGRRIVVVAGPGEQAYARPIAEALGDHGLLASTTVGQMMALLSGTRLLVCNDSAPLHIAVGLGRPVVAIFGPTDPNLVGPYHRMESVVQPPAIDRFALTHYRKRPNDQTLIAQVTVDMAWRRVLAELDRG